MRALIIFTLLASFSAFAQSATNLECGRTTGGPSATIQMILEPLADSSFRITVHLVNANFPTGVVGTYQGFLLPDGTLLGSGSINALPSDIRIHRGEPSRLLVIYAQGDQGERSVEYGFGLHTRCQAI